MLDGSVLVSGGEGFVGGFLKLLPSVKSFCHDNGESIDIFDSNSLVRKLKDTKPNYIIHLAAQSSVPEAFKSPEETYRVNFLGTLNILNCLKAVNFKGRFLYVSTGDVYGAVAEQSLPISEALSPKPLNPYAVSKVAAESLCYQWSQTEPFDVVIARPFNHIGPGQDARFIISSLAEQLLEIKLGNRPPRLDVGNLSVTRDFTDVRDVVAAYLLLLKMGRNGEIYNVCSGVERKVSDLLSMLAKILDVEYRINLCVDRLRPNEQLRAKGDNMKLVADTSWAPKYSIKSSLTDILDHLEC